jgi:hypothetical protein
MFGGPELFADVADVHVDDSIEWTEFSAEDRLRELFTRDDAPGLA